MPTQLGYVWFRARGDFIWRRVGGAWMGRTVDPFSCVAVYRRGRTGVLPMQGLPIGMGRRRGQATGLGVEMRDRFESGLLACVAAAKGESSSNRPSLSCACVCVCVDSLCFHVRHCWFGAGALKGKKKGQHGWAELHD
ncbi:hypothetical protein L1887_57707 [Cichorium endivia]|nr:hypothetical protein L1887_57707 [Cichorium endivia]